MRRLVPLALALVVAGCGMRRPRVAVPQREVIIAWLEPSLRDAQPEERFQFVRHGYFVADRRDSRPGKPVFNRDVTLRDSWTKGA